MYDKLTSSYSSKNVGDVLGSIRLSIPPLFIIDLRRVDYLAVDNTLRVSLKGTFPSESDTIHSSPLSPLTSNWIKNDFEVVSVGSYPGDVYEIDLALEVGKCRILLDSARSRGFWARLSNKVTLLFVPSEHLVSLNQFMKTEFQISLNGFDPLKLLAVLETKLSKCGLYYAFRHRDLHAMNCLVSRSNFKVLDVGDSAEAMICSDIARLEVSLLSRLVQDLQLQAGDVETVLGVLDDPAKSQKSPITLSVISKITRELRNCFLPEFRTAPTSLDLALCYYNECCQQLSWSISSPVGFRKGTDPLISYWDRKLRELIQ